MRREGGERERERERETSTGERHGDLFRAGRERANLFGIHDLFAWRFGVFALGFLH